ncbi:MAG: single-stranded DNA-binding protein, partial [Candidatus Aminicenantes bacterium]|nr:single-stranded DNA-binding protein [Candidatus Aminicenantes bacterium]
MSQVRSLNRVILVGRMGKDPEITVLASSGRQLAKFSLA